MQDGFAAAVFLWACGFLCYREPEGDPKLWKFLVDEIVFQQIIMGIRHIFGWKISAVFGGNKKKVERADGIPFVRRSSKSELRGFSTLLLLLTISAPLSSP